jgi:K+-sensing histidine kinase KdpD
MKGYIEILGSENSKISSKNRKRCFDQLNKNTLRLERFAELISEFNLLKQGMFNLRLDTVNLADLLEIVFYQYKILLGDQFSYFITSEQDEDLIAKLDSERFALTLDCIIQNAIEHTSVTQRKIVASCTILSGSNSISIKISDNGAGIPSENLEKIKKQFGSIPTKYSLGGIGIGLYLSNVIIEKHKGKLSIRSLGFDKGTTAEIEIPRIVKPEIQLNSLIE